MQQAAHEILNLDGAWSFTHVETATTHPARVPGSVHNDLLDAGVIPDPFDRAHEEQLLWIGESTWDYTRCFQVPHALLAHEHVMLRCDGLDTLAEIYVNETLVAKPDNMFRTWLIDLRAVLQPGENQIRIRFASPLPVIRQRQLQHHLHSWHGPREPSGRAWIRKEPCNFGWDWGPVMVSCGIWRTISIQAWTGPRLTDILIRQTHDREGTEVRLAIHPESYQPLPAGLRYQATARFQDRIVATQTVNDPNTTGLSIPRPMLWWPNKMGDQPLYQIELTLLSREDKPLDRITRTIGLRTLRLDRQPDEWGESFQFVVNGVPFFAKGANWIPGDAVPARMPHEAYRRTLQAAADANMNMLRVWGGGIYEDDHFYRICDELGICVWQDFMFACSCYPTFDPAFMDSVAAEAVDNIRRIRHHACLALWCGNNELEQGLVGDADDGTQMSWADYRRLFDDLLPGLLREHDPDRDYWPCSPHTPHGDRAAFNDPTCGDAHLWEVWHGRRPFEWYRECTHRFNSEFGFQSFPEPKTVHMYCPPGERNITSYTMEHHQRSGIGNSVIMQYMLDWFRLPNSFENTLWLSQILQGMAIKYAVEHWRRSMPRGMGTLYWQLNDCWPVASWSSLDYFGRWKALHFMARHFYAPTLLSALELPDEHQVELHITHDRLQARSGRVEFQWFDMQGRTLETGEIPFTAAANADTVVGSLPYEHHIQTNGPRDLLLWVGLQDDAGKEPGAENLVLFARPKHLESAPVQIAHELHQDRAGGFRLTLSSSVPVLWVWVELGAINADVSDNFFHLLPGKPRTLHITPSKPITHQEMIAQLKIRHLAETYTA